MFFVKYASHPEFAVLSLSACFASHWYRLARPWSESTEVMQSGWAGFVAILANTRQIGIGWSLLVDPDNTTGRVCLRRIACWVGPRPEEWCRNQSAEASSYSSSTQGWSMAGFLQHNSVIFFLNKYCTSVISFARYFEDKANLMESDERGQSATRIIRGLPASTSKYPVRILIVHTTITKQFKKMVRVTPSYGGGYQDEEDTTFRRYSSRGHGYPLLHDRVFPVASHDVYPGARSHHPIPRDSRAIRQSPESDSSSRPRSRIPVACGRCRKRKIKCSGDTGGPCTSCISAGNDQCQFLRVLSEPATLKQECSTYDFDPSGGAASRLNSRTGTMPFGSHAFVPQSAPLSPDGYQYRNTSLPAYPYTIRPFYAMPSYGDFGEEGVDYGLQVPLMGTEHLALTPNYITSSAAGRGWTPQMPRTPLYVEQSETPYNHNQLPFHGYPPRLNSNSEIKHGSLNGIGGSLPPPSLINGNVDRMLPPVPSSNNRTAQIGPYLRSNDGLPATTTLQTQPYPDFGMIRNSKHHNNNTISDNSSMASVSYMPMSNINVYEPTQ
ncbi:hypothetical protein WAI453_000491 [Rhynchosporium graminicola]